MTGLKEILPSRPFQAGHPVECKLWERKGENLNRPNRSLLSNCVPSRLRKVNRKQWSRILTSKRCSSLSELIVRAGPMKSIAPNGGGSYTRRTVGVGHGGSYTTKYRHSHKSGCRNGQARWSEDFLAWLTWRQWRQVLSPQHCKLTEDKTSKTLCYSVRNAESLKSSIGASFNSRQSVIIFSREVL